MPQCTLATRSAAMLVMIFVAGCSPATLGATPAASTTTTAPTAAPLSASAVPTLQPTPAVIVDAGCIPIMDETPADLPLSGVWVRNEYTPYLEDAVTLADIRIPLKGGGAFGQWSGDAAVSPDAKHLAYIDQYYDPVVKYQPVKRILRVVSSSGHTLQMAYWKEDWQYIIGWVDDQTVALFTSARALVTLNPFTGDWQSLPEPAWLVSMGYTGDKYSFIGYPPLLFAPTADRILIRREDRSFDVRDRRSGAVLFHGSTRYEVLGWSSDASMFAFIAGSHLTTVMQNRPVEDLDLSQTGAVLDWYGDLKPSPNGEKIAFAGANWSPKTEGPRLLVYDRAHSHLHWICDDEYVVDGPWQSAWSPDGRFLIVAVAARTEAWPRAEYDLLMDTQELRAYRLISGQRQHRLFWLASP